MAKISDEASVACKATYHTSHYHTIDNVHEFSSDVSAAVDVRVLC